MLSTISSFSSLYLATLLMLIGTGLFNTYIGLRLTAESVNEIWIGALIAGYYLGLVCGARMGHKLIIRVGHIRAFVACAAISTSMILAQMLVDYMPLWLVFRLVAGIVMVTQLMVIESWLNERATNESRGMIFSFYISITLLGVVGGQMTVAFADIKVQTLFLMAGIYYCFAMLPTLVSNAQTPKPLSEVKLDLVALYRNSPVSFFGILLVGIANGAWGTLGAVFGAKAGLSTGDVALMMTITIFAGAAMQIPAGRMSDRMDRRYVL
ncbi:MAG TPA: MFS transporter, partial [Bordetella sp.]|nr:MFS transporter [Bordetella sp.]